MYFRNQNIEEVKTELQTQLDNYKSALAAWQAVTIHKKKDNSEFAQIGRALEGAHISTSCPNDAAHPAIEITYKNKHGYNSDTLDIYFYCDQLPDKGASRETVFDGGIWQRKTSPMNAEEIRAAIANRIEIYKNRVETLKKQLEIAEKAFTNYRAAIAKAEKELREICNTARETDEIGETSLYYAITAGR